MNWHILYQFGNRFIVVIHVTELSKLGQKKLFSSLYLEWAAFPDGVFEVGWGRSGKAGWEWKRETGHWAMSPPKFENFLMFLDFLKSKVFFFFSCVGTKAPPSAKMPWGS